MFVREVVGEIVKSFFIGELFVGRIEFFEGGDVAMGIKDLDCLDLLGLVVILWRMVWLELLR